MYHRRTDAMRHAVDLARTGLFANWSSVAARLRASKYREADVDWTPGSGSGSTGSAPRRVAPAWRPTHRSGSPARPSRPGSTCPAAEARQCAPA